jgi:tetratricopeptide (TPR) repeat protein
MGVNREHTVTNWSLLIILPLLLVIIFTPSTALQQGTQWPINLADYPPEVQELIEKTYLGHAEEFPDPGEPAVVLRKYLERDIHQYLEPGGLQLQKLDRVIAEWEDLVTQYPESRHALVGLAQHYKMKADFYQDGSLFRRAADLYIRAAEIGLQHGRIRYTREISDLLVELSDEVKLDQIFGLMLAGPQDADHDRYYLALMDYADALARLDEYERAWDYFEQAIDFYPENNIEAINRYTMHLLDQGQGKLAFAVLDNRLTPLQRIRHVQPAYLRKRAMELIGLDTESADAEIAQIRERFSDDRPFFFSNPDWDQVEPEIKPAFVHNNLADDCRAQNCAVAFCNPVNGDCFGVVVVNFAEVLWQEARGERVGAQGLVGWTIRNRILQGLSCDSYFGGLSSQATCRSRFVCNIMDTPGAAQQAKDYCCAIHGGTTTAGQSQQQFNDAHVPWQTLIASGLPYRAVEVINGFLPEVSTNFAPSGVAGCDFSCDVAFCLFGNNKFEPSPRGPMEFMGVDYQAQAQQCKERKGNVCGNTPGTRGDNYFWNRKIFIRVIQPNGGRTGELVAHSLLDGRVPILAAM